MDNEGPTYMEGQHVTLNCSVGYYGNVPPTLTWKTPNLLDGHLVYTENVSSHVFIKDGVKENIITGLMNVTLRHRIDGRMFTCNIKFPGTVMTYSCTTSFPPQSVQCKLLFSSWLLITTKCRLCVICWSF